MTFEESKPFLKELLDGKSLQFRNRDTGRWEDSSICPLQLLYSYQLENVRIKPVKKIVPLTLDDIIVGRDLLRLRQDILTTRGPLTSLVTDKTDKFVVFNTNVCHDMKVLMEYYERSIDGEKSWQRCCKEIEE